MAGRVLPAAYATVCTSVAVSARAAAPLQGFFEGAARQLVGSWQYGHLLTRPVLVLLLGLTSPEDACCIARVRLMAQLVNRDAGAVFELVDAVWNRATPWGQLLTEACQEVSQALPGRWIRTEVTVAYVRRMAPYLLKACRHLSRYGSAYRAFIALWQDVVRPRTVSVIGARAPQPCSLCGVVLPSRHALAAHIHRKHSVVNCLTQFTLGTVCLWCHVEHHSTDRLKYHLGRSPGCLHGLRVVVGPAYVYGSGTKRKGCTSHRGLPPLRLPGPLNATPAQRLAADEGRQCTEEELLEERRRQLGIDSVHDWPEVVPLLGSAIMGEVGGLAAPAAVPLETPEDAQAIAAGPICSSTVTLWYGIADASALRDLGLEWLWQVVSPRWPGLLCRTICWRLPSSWHRYWNLWWSAHSFEPWAASAKRGFRALRAALDSQEMEHITAPPLRLQSLIADTVTFRMICQHVRQGGAFWMQGRPSSVGLALLRDLLPQAHFPPLSRGAGQFFYAAHSSMASSVVSRLSATTAGTAPLGVELLVRPSAVYRSADVSPMAGRL